MACALRLRSASCVLFSLALLHCGGSDDETTGTTTGAGGSSAGSAGSKAGTGGSSAGAGGSTAGGGGSSAGAGGSSAGAGGSTAGGGGSSAGAGGSTAGGGGSSAGAGMAGAGAGGAGAGMAGAGGSATSPFPSTCADAAAAPSAFGCTFWAVDLDQKDYLSSDPASAPWGLIVTNPQAVAVTVTVERNDAAPGVSPMVAKESEVSVPAGGTATITLPTREVDCGAKPNDVAAPGTCLSSRALRVTATLPVTVTQQNTLTDVFSSDTSLLLPTTALGTSYRAVAAPPAHPVPMMVGFAIADRSFVTIVGTEAGTQVEVTPSFRVKGNGAIPATPAGGKLTATLGPYDVLNLESDDATSADPAPAADLTGTLVTASAKVVVFAGAEAAQSPTLPGQPVPPGADTCCTDHVEDQLLPTSTWGKTHVVPRSQPRGTSAVEADLVRFVAGSAPAKITTTLPGAFASFTLAAGQSSLAWATTDFVVESDTPIEVALLLVGKQATEMMIGDPSLAVVPPVEQHASFAAFSAPAGVAAWVSIGAPTGTSLTLDGTALAGCSPVVALPGWDLRRCPVTAGAHTLAGTSPFVALVGGYGPSSSVLTAASTRAVPVP